MLIAMAKEDADNLQSELDKRKVRYCEVGYVKEGNGAVNVLKNAKVTET
jgi:hydrogenase maturation factor HypE